MLIVYFIISYTLIEKLNSSHDENLKKEIFNSFMI
jgi:hypothetical protein